MRKLLASYLSDILLLAGCMCIEIGLAQWSPIAAWIVGVVMLIGLSVLIGKVKAKNAT